MLDLIKNGKTWKDTIAQRIRTMCTILGKIQQDLVFQNLLCPFVFEDKDSSFLLIQRGHLSHEGFITCLRRLDSSFCACYSSNSFSLKYSVYQAAVSWGPVNMSCHYLPLLSIPPNPIYILLSFSSPLLLYVFRNFLFLTDTFC